MNFSQLECVVVLAQTGSFTEAAYNLSLTQSAVSHALAALERELGITLFERNRKGVVMLSQAGQRILPHIQALLGEADTIKQEAKLLQGTARGKLRLGNVLSFCPCLFAGVLTDFQQKYPEIEVVLFEGTLQEVSEWIEGNIVDVGFVLHPAKGLESTLVGTDELFVVVPSGHPLQAQPAVSAFEVGNEPFIMSKTGQACQVIEMAGLGPVKPHIRYQASDSATILSMVKERLGITIMSRMLLPRQLDGVVALPLNPARQLQIGLAVKSKELASPAAKLFVQTALAQYPKQKENSPQSTPS